MDAILTLAELHEAHRVAVDSMNFEEAGRLRDQIKARDLRNLPVDGLPPVVWEDPDEPAAPAAATTVLGLRVYCVRCKRMLTEPGGILLTPPDPIDRVTKHHVCVDCWRLHYDPEVPR